MSSRSRRNTAPTRASGPASVRAGVASLWEGNEHAVRQMLSLGTEHADLTPKLLECMGVNSLSAEMLLARFFDAQLLAEYCTQRLGKSAKGAAATGLTPSPNKRVRCAEEAKVLSWEYLRALFSLEEH